MIIKDKGFNRAGAKERLVESWEQTFEDSEEQMEGNRVHLRY
jgi:hypothetical protein